MSTWIVFVLFKDLRLTTIPSDRWTGAAIVRGSAALLTAHVDVLSDMFLCQVEVIQLGLKFSMFLLTWSTYSSYQIARRIFADHFSYVWGFF